MVNSALIATTLLFFTACEKVPAKQSRLFTDDELAALETRVLAEVNKSRRDCIRSEALALWKPTGDLAACIKECDVLDYGVDHRKPIRRDELFRIATPEASALDAKCGALVSAAFERAAANPGCSPYQIGIDNADGVRTIVPRFHLLHLLARHAHAQDDHAAAARSLVAALQTLQDSARGRVNDYVTASALRSSAAFNLIELLDDAQLTRNDLDALATSIDHLIASEPSPHEMLQAQAVYMAFVYGLVPVKGPSWPIPGGRSEIFEIMESSRRPSTSHDPRDDAGIMMMSALESGERLRTACPPTASLRECFAPRTARPDTTTAAHGGDPLDRPRKDDAATRARVKREIVDSYLASEDHAYLIVMRAKGVVPLVALRLRIEILRRGRCPTAAELDAPPYSTLRAPSVLGDSIQVTPIKDALRVDAPAWVRDHIEQDRKNRKPPFPPRTPPEKILSIPCP